MVRCCSAYGCCNRDTVQNRMRGVKLHRFPNDPFLRGLWVKAVKRVNPVNMKQDWIPGSGASLCSHHFLPSCYVDNKLKGDAIPSVFSFSKPIFERTSNTSINAIASSSCNVPTEVVIPSNFDQMKQIQGEHMYALPKPSKIVADRSTLLETIDSLQSQLEEANRQLKNATAREIRAKSTKSALQEMLKEKNLLNSELKKSLEKFEHFPMNLYEREAHGAYNKEMKKFALTLHLYGPKAYDFASKTFSLPKAVTLRKWLSNIDGKPGFSSQALDYLRQQRSGPSGHMYEMCAVILDAMSIRKEIMWDPKEQKFIGHIDLGDGEESQDPASEALVIMVNGLKGYWKLPIAYFLTKCLSARVQAQLLTDAFEMLIEVGVVPLSLTLDGHNTNLATVRKLGCSTKPHDIDSKIPFHKSPFGFIYVFFDACHMIKLARNLLASSKTIIIPNVGVAEWKHIVSLNDVQKKEGVRLACKISDRHIDWESQKMKVNLAVQTLSSSTASALQFLRQSGHSEFQSSEATEIYCRTFDRLFDILNSRSPFDQGFKQSINAQNLPKIRCFFENTKQWLLSLQKSSARGNYEISDTAKTVSVVGLVFCMESVLEIASNCLSPSISVNHLQYILTYKFSQDHLELLFNAVRRAGGWNNNPTVVHFRYVFRRLIARAGVIPSLTGNVCPISGIDDESEDLPDLLEISDTPPVLESGLSHIIGNAAAYMAGWVVRKLLKRLRCDECRDCIVEKPNCQHTSNLDLLRIKNKGGLVVPSPGVSKVVFLTEKYYRENDPHSIDFNKAYMYILATLGNKVFGLFLHDHFTDATFSFDSHLFIVLKLIVKFYFDLRQQHFSNILNSNLTKKRIRHKLTKSILFQNQ